MALGDSFYGENQMANILDRTKPLNTLVATCLFLTGTIQSPAPVYSAKISPAQSLSNKKKKTTLFGQVSGSGTLLAMASSGKKLGQCPLKNTSVEAKISGYVSRVKVKQTFANPFKEKIEAVYTFPLSNTGAVDSMLMKIGNRTISGSIKKKEEARKIYNQAKARGHVASLLDQERPNIFTQAVANIEPGKQVEIIIEYIDLLPFEAGKYSFRFPTVVGPRFIPGSPTSKTGTGRVMDTDQVPDASKITPPVTPKGTRAGHDISIAVELDASMPIGAINSKLHQVDIKRDSKNKARISLTSKKTIPNKDFVLDWQVATNKVESGYLTYRNPQKDKSGYFTLMLLPPQKLTTAQIAAKEMIFLIDCSGSQSGRPLAKAKETLNYIVDHMNPQDTFQVVSFNSSSEMLYDKPRPSTNANKQKAKQYIKHLRARGGTWMEPAVRKVCAIKAPQNRLRIVSFMTDGYVGNDMQIMGLIKELRGQSRWFPFGTGNSVNRFLINGIASEGGGEPEFVLLNSKPGVVGKKFYDRISSPVLTDVKVEFNGVKVKEVFPKNVSDVWAQKPLYIKGRYLEPGIGTVTLTGLRAGKPYKQILKVNFPNSNTTNSGIASVWARAKVDRLMSENWIAAQRGRLNKELKDEIVEVALKHHIMTQFTSFVAVDKKTITKNGKSKTVVVPVELPEGVSREKTIADGMLPAAMPAPMPLGGAGGIALQSRTRGLRGTYGSANASALPRGVVWNKPMFAHKRAKTVHYRGPYKKLAKPKADHEAKEEQKDKSNNLAVALKRLTATSLTDLKSKGFTVKGQKLKVMITLSKFDSSVIKALGLTGLSELKTILVRSGTYKVTGFISLKDLSKLAKLNYVSNIEPTK